MTLRGGRSPRGNIGAGSSTPARCPGKSKPRQTHSGGKSVFFAAIRVKRRHPASASLELPIANTVRNKSLATNLQIVLFNHLLLLLLRVTEFSKINSSQSAFTDVLHCISNACLYKCNLGGDVGIETAA